MRKILVATALLTIVAARVSAVDITSCGQVVANGDVGVLAADLTCPGIAVVAGVLSDSGRANARVTIQLNGHTISAGAGILCNARCTVEGPGTIRDGESGIYVSAYPGDLTLRDLLLQHNEYGVGQAGRAVTLENVEVSDNVEAGLVLYSTRRVSGSNVTVSRNGGWGIKADLARIMLTGLTAENNTGGAVIGSKRRVTLIDSTLSGNEFDVFSWRAPQLINTSCELSQGPNRDGSGLHTWGVCSND
jgi:hypothetical protein